MIREGMMSLGHWDLSIEDAPRAVRSKLREFDLLAITPSWTPEAMTLPELLSVASFTGVIRERRRGGRWLGGPSAVWYLGDEQGANVWSRNIDTVLGPSFADTWAVLLEGAAPPAGTGTDYDTGIVPGQIKAGNVHPTLVHGIGRGWSIRRYLDDPEGALRRRHPDIAWRLHPNLTLDVDDDSALWSTTPEVFIGQGIDASDADIRVIPAELDSVDADGSRWVNAVHARSDSTTVGYSPLSTNPYRAPSMERLTHRAYIEADDDDELVGVAEAEWRRRRVRRTWEVTSVSDDVDLRRHIEPGQWVWLHDPTAGVEDPANPVEIAGQTTFPELDRVAAIEWPMTEGHGAYGVALGDHGDFNVLSPRTVPEIVDLTEFVDWERGAPVIEVGAQSPALEVL